MHNSRRQASSDRAVPADGLPESAAQRKGERIFDGLWREQKWTSWSMPEGNWCPSRSSSRPHLIRVWLRPSRSGSRASAKRRCPGMSCIRAIYGSLSAEESWLCPSRSCDPPSSTIQLPPSARQLFNHRAAGTKHQETRITTFMNSLTIALTYISHHLTAEARDKKGSG